MANPSDSPRPRRYRLYIDESGDHAYSKLSELSHRYLGLLGIWLQQPDAYTTFADALEEFKRSIFGPRPDDPINLHRSDIINRRGSFALLQDSAIRTRFDTGLLNLVEQAQFKMVCVVIDKRAQRRGYTQPWHPYHFSLAAMLDRYSGWLNYSKAKGDVMAESRNRAEDMSLKEAYKQVYEEAIFSMFDIAFHQRALTSKKLKLKKKEKNIAGLQLADILANPIKRHCLATKGLAPPIESGFVKELESTAIRKFNIRYDTMQIDGYGRVYLPHA